MEKFIILLNLIISFYQGPRSYLAVNNEKIFIVTGTGIIGYANLEKLIEKKILKLEI